MTKALITGAGGFIGRPLLRALNVAGVSTLPLTRADGDVAAPETWLHLPAVDHVFHLAGRSYVPDSWQDGAGFMHANVVGTQRALEYCRSHGAKMTFVSAYLYGIPRHLPIGEGDEIRPNNPYALSKHLAEQLCEFYATYHGVAVTVIRPFNVFGPGQRREFLIPEILEQIRIGREIRLKDLEPKRDYVYLNDVVEALVKTLCVGAGYNVINIGSGISYSVREMVDIIQHVAGTDLPVVSDAMVRPQEIPDVRADITRAQELLGWAPHHSFAEGIAKMLQVEKKL